MANFTIEKGKQKPYVQTGEFDETLNSLCLEFESKGYKPDSNTNRALYNGSRKNICGGTSYRKGNTLVIITWDSIR